jgi:hypothetical protein
MSTAFVYVPGSATSFLAGAVDLKGNAQLKSESPSPNIIAVPKPAGMTVALDGLMAFDRGGWAPVQPLQQLGSHGKVEPV